MGGGRQCVAREIRGGWLRLRPCTARRAAGRAPPRIMASRRPVAKAMSVTRDGLRGSDPVRRPSSAVCRVRVLPCPAVHAAH